MRVRSLILCLAACIGCGIVLTACNTAQGFGKDVKNLGQSIETKAAEKKAE